jgi:hypothetical protein
MNRKESSSLQTDFHQRVSQGDSGSKVKISHRYDHLNRVPMDDPLHSQVDDRTNDRRFSVPATDDERAHTIANFLFARME